MEQQHRVVRAAELGRSGRAVRSYRHALLAAGGVDVAFSDELLELFRSHDLWNTVALTARTVAFRGDAFRARSRSGCALENLATSAQRRFTVQTFVVLAAPAESAHRDSALECVLGTWASPPKRACTSFATPEVHHSQEA